MKNKNIILGIVIVIIVVALITLSNSNKEKQAIGIQNNSSDTIDVQNEDIVKSNDVNTIAGSYELYSPEKLSFAEIGNVVLFFSASWCPTCRNLDKNIKGNLGAIPEDLKILVVDFDDSRELRKKYRVTTQHTLVQIDKDGNMISKWSGSPTLSSLVSQIK